ncbi:MAG: DUF1559 domain-containing protein, partial [Planctomycetaceae bacterium]|nr:DUF1559 domain-containing protein [Planctomycetaceae bacterium]
MNSISLSLPQLQPVDLRTLCSFALTIAYVFCAIVLVNRFRAANALSNQSESVSAINHSISIGSRSRFTISDLLELIGVLSIGFVIVSNYPLVERPNYEDVRICQNNLRLIANALDNYAQVFGRYPPISTPGADGSPAHSWRVLLLPYFGKPALEHIYDQYHFDEPWNGPSNSSVIQSGGAYVYRCNRCSIDPLGTSYFAVQFNSRTHPTSQHRTNTDRFAVVEKAMTQV